MPYKGYGVIRLSENAGRSTYNSLQIGVDRRYRNGFKFGAAYTLGKSEDNASDKRNVLFNTYDDSGYWGPSSFDRRHVFTFYYIYDLPFFQEQTSLTSRILGGWQISGATFMRTGTPLWVTRGDDVAGVGDTFGQPWNQVGDPSANANGQFSQGTSDPELLLQSGGVRASRQPARSATRRATGSTTRVSISGTSRSSRMSRCTGPRACSSGRSSSISSTTRTGTARRRTRPTRHSAASRARTTRGGTSS